MGRTLLGDDRFSVSGAGGVCQPGKYGRLKKGRCYLSARGTPILAGQRQHGRETAAPITHGAHGRRAPVGFLRADGDYFG
jgi:hypothetical protein